MDVKISQLMNAQHQKTQDRHNRQVKERHGYTIGDRILLNKPSQVGGHKIQTLWTGPAQILSRTGASSYIISNPHGTT